MSILEKAKQIVDEDRRKEYGDVKDGFQKIADLWSAYLGTPITVHQVAHMMILTKVARLQHNPSHLDSITDIVGYSLCIEKLL